MTDLLPPLAAGPGSPLASPTIDGAARCGAPGLFGDRKGCPVRVRHATRVMH